MILYLERLLYNEIIHKERMSIMFLQPFKSVIVGVDFSDYSKVVVKQAMLLSHQWKSKLVLVYAIHDTVDYSITPFGDAFFPNFIDFSSYKTNIKKEYKIKNSKVDIITEFDTPTNLIIETAKKYESPLIVTGYKGNGKISEFFFGSTAQQLALKSKIPVWIHRGSKVITPRRVLIPHDLSKVSNHSIDLVEKLSLAYPTSYEVFHVKKTPYPVLDYKTYKDRTHQVKVATKNKVKQLVHDYPNIKTVTASGEVTEEIVKRAKNFDLLVLTHHNPKTMMSKSETVALMKRNPTPILVTN